MKLILLRLLAWYRSPSYKVELIVCIMYQIVYILRQVLYLMLSYRRVLYLCLRLDIYHN